MSIAGVTPCALAKWLMHTDGMANVHVTPGLRLMVERLQIDGQLMEGQYVESTKFKVDKVLH